MGIITGSSGNIVDVDSSGRLKVINPSNVDANGNPSNAGNYVTMVCESDAGSITGSPTQRQADISSYYRQRVGLDTLLFYDRFGGTQATLTTAPSTNIWSTSQSTMVSTYTNGAYTMNSGSSVATNVYSVTTSYRTFQYLQGFPLQCEIQAVYVGTSGQTNVVCELGMGFAATNAAPTDGAYFRYDSDGTFDCVIRYGAATEIKQSGTLAIPTVNVVHNYLIVFANGSVEFWVDSVLYANLTFSTTGAPTLTANLPIFFRIYNGGSAPSSAVQLALYGCDVAMGDMNMTKEWSHIMASCGNMALQHQSGINVAAGSTALYTNSLAVGAGAAATNTTAALGSGLGGQFTVLPTLAVPTDGIIQSYQIPVVGASTTARNLYITGINFQAVVTTLFVGGPVIYFYSLALGHTAVSLATAEALTTKSPRRIPLGIDVFPVTAAVGTIGSNFYRQFSTPIFLQPGEFIQFVAKNVGTVTTSGTVTFIIGYDGYWD